MATNRITDNDSAGTGTLVKEIARDFETLVQQHMRLFKADMKEDLRKLRDGAFSIAIGLTVVLIGGLLLGMALAELLALVLPQPAAYAIVGGAVAVAGGVMLYLGQQTVKSAAPIAENTLETLEEDVQWMKNPK